MADILRGEVGQKGRRMTVTIELPPDIEAGLLVEAEAAGLGVADYLQSLVRGQLTPKLNTGTHPAKPGHLLPPEEWASKFEAWTRSHVGNTVVLPDEAMERESIYADDGV